MRQEKKYSVTFTISYEVEAEDISKAVEKARDMLTRDIEDNYSRFCDPSVAFMIEAEGVKQ